MDAYYSFFTTSLNLHLFQCKDGKNSKSLTRSDLDKMNLRDPKTLAEIAKKL